MTFDERQKRLIYSMWAHGTPEPSLAWGFGVAVAVIEEVIRETILTQAKAVQGFQRCDTITSGDNVTGSDPTTAAQGSKCCDER